MMLEYKKLWVNGCSLSFGGEILGYMDYSLGNLSKAWPIHLGKMLGVNEVINSSKCASSNISIFRSTLFELSKIDTSNMFVIIQWTNTSRTEIVYDPKDIDIPIDHEAFFRENRIGITNGFIPKKIKKNVDFFWNWQADKIYQDELWLTYIISMQNFLKNRNINYIMVNGLDILSSKSVIESQLYKDIDIEKYYGFDSKTFFKKDILNNISHPNEEQHKEYAKELYNYIIEIHSTPL